MNAFCNLYPAREAQGCILRRSMVIMIRLCIYLYLYLLENVRVMKIDVIIIIIIINPLGNDSPVRMYAVSPLLVE